MIRFANISDVEKIMSFIDSHWRKGHIMARDRRLFEFQHLWNTNEVSFVIAEEATTEKHTESAEDENTEIKGILGFIPYDTLPNERDITLAIWKTIKTANTMLGVDMLRFLRKNGHVHSMAAPGINRKTMPIYNFFGYHTGEMTHWYRLCKGKTPRIAKINDWGSEADSAKCKELVTTTITTEKKDILIKQLNAFDENTIKDFEFCSGREKQLHKSIDFIKRRYYEHPYFKYEKCGFVIDDKELIMIFRVQPCNDSNALRLVDCIGDHEILQFVTPIVDELMRNLSCEYVDCYEAGVPAKYFENAGWLNVDETDNIIPDYFAPFEQKNVKIYYMAEVEGTCLFKGDGDMDRPN